MNFIQGVKHPATDLQIFKNVWEWDRIRRILKSRCAICDAVVSRDEKAVKELIYQCSNASCTCNNSGSKAHQVCSLCYDLFHSLYVNYQLKDMNYFRNLDEAEAKERGDDTNRRRRMGL